MILPFWAKSTRGRWLNLALLLIFAALLAPAAETPASLAKTYREAPSPARRTALERYAAAHSKSINGVLARLALGVTAFEQKDWPGAIQHLNNLRLPKLADYVAYYVAAARLESKDVVLNPKGLSPVYGSPAPSPLAARAAVLEGRTLVAASAARDAIRILTARYAELPQPQGDMALAAAYEAAGDRSRAALSYQLVYYQHPLTYPAIQAETALAGIKTALGSAYPPPSPALMLTRADRLLEGRDWQRARAEYQLLGAQLGGPEGDLAKVRAGVADYLAGNTGEAHQHLRSLNSKSGSEADAERLYYLAECARRLGNDEEMMEHVKRLGRAYPRSTWRLKALVSAANRYLIINEPDKFVPLFKSAYEDFPADPQAPYCHWKVAWNSYINRKRDADDRLRKHLETFPLDTSASAALYFLGRLAERDRHLAEARAYYSALSDLYPNYYYGLQARERLSDTKLARAVPASKTLAYLSGIRFPPRPEGPPANASPATVLRIERARLLRSAGLDELAESELRFGSRSGEQGTLLAMELARGGAEPHEKLRFMKSMRIDYLAIPVKQAPAAYWENLFPLPFRNDVVRNARQHNLDPFKVAGLIRQESEFNPRAVSRTNAHGLTQVMPGTGRQLAPKVGIRRFNSKMLFQPSVNLKLGTFYMRSLLDKWDGKWEETLASYNAGSTRVAEWAGWYSYDEPAEFIETIPFTETREYVQAVLRNAAMYRLIYEEKPAPSTAAKPRRAD
ncbi:MAG TPA: transglycosylase SLT domain-containing protein [Bryobacteraceae bacterium]|nr:transglycosylase SLT domain-containing protein [Bryobacteraceae bacterium]